MGYTLVLSYLGREAGARGGRRVRVTAFNIADGSEAWSTLCPLSVYRPHASSLGLMPRRNGAVVLVPCGSGTVGLEATTGKILWSFELAAALPEVVKQVPAEFTGPAAAKYLNELKYPYPNLAPIAWEDLVIDSTSFGHDCAASRTWCIDVSGGEPKLVWETQDFVPFNEMQRSNMLIHDGRLYGFDARGGWRRSGNPAGLSGRPARAAGEQSFQCRDVRTGRLLWSSDALDGAGGEWQPSRLTVVGDRLVTCNRRGITLSRLRDDGLELLGSLTSMDGSPVLSDPVVVDGRLYVRQLTPTQSGKGWGPAGQAGVVADLLAIDLR